MTANVSIVVDKKENILTAINPALKFTLLGKDVKYDTQGIWVLKNNKPTRVDIQTGVYDDSKTEIISNELKEGDLGLIARKGMETSTANEIRPPSFL